MVATLSSEEKPPQPDKAAHGRRGRRALPEDERRTIQVVVRLSTAEAAELADRAARAGCRSTAGFMREAALGRQVTGGAWSLAPEDAVALGRIGANVNQLAKRVNCSVFTSEHIDLRALQATLAEVLRELRAIRLREAP